MRVTQPFDFTQGREPAERPFGFAQGHELVEWQMGVFRQPLNNFVVIQRSMVYIPLL
jgi:hypothetical protein